ncbi:Spo0E family sporulation regulatory protein-aspartic acid phosphatase [Clostridium sp. CCUG 7971]|uniref:Spo0E family sporulation regulatory protein-aspartic acid phosphatase n=1 Tax=Clostridium sp. CCUG 7971 TaxID=2811414 RepID=UPI001ABA0952|nr:Spo0E family sporulation regulatory protein-aspartic acid phosphatase [Clostridium sp. CCUG 7971]MBO3443394.1 Spo0E family sporulation regulatory protein-aspartic acid phosphatase [Clostridium sp. CCUG 7971]
MREYKHIETLKSILGDLYIRYGITDEVVRLSQWIDEVVVNIQKNKYKKHIENFY